MSTVGSTPQREKVVKMSKSKRDINEVQRSTSEDEMETIQQQSKTESTEDDPVFTNRLTFRADPELLEPKEKQRKKLSRNQIEKFRRDRLNAYFMELAKLVPLVMQTSKKIDKATILRLTVAYLRIYYDLVKGSKRSKASRGWRPDLTMHENLGNLLLESFGGFLLVISKKGVLYFATEAITKYLGHNLSDVLGLEVKNIIHPDDYKILDKQFELTERDCLIKDTDDENDLAHVPVNGQRSFCIKMLNVLDPQSTCYEIVHLVGHLKKMPQISRDNVTPGNSGGQSKQEPSICLVAVAKLIARQPIQELTPIMNNTSNQWITRHELDGKITYSDQRGALLTGFLPGESIGFSPYSLLHPDDIPAVVAVHNLFLTDGCVPLTVFRMYTKSREILYIQTNTHMVVDSWTSKPKFIISINTVLDEKQGMLALEDQRRRIDNVRKICGSDGSLSSTEDVDDCSENATDTTSSVHSDFGSDFIMPEVREIDESTVDVVVGMNKFRINLSENGKFNPKSPPNDHASISMVFDSHATKDDGGKSIPMIKPSFLDGMVSDNRTSFTDDSASNDSSSCLIVELQQPSDNKVNLIQSSPESRLLQRVSSGESSSLAQLLLSDVRMLDAAKTANDQGGGGGIGSGGGGGGGSTNRMEQKHLLLRQLLMPNKSQEASNGHILRSQEEEEQAPQQSPLEFGKSMPLGSAAESSEYSQIKSLLQDRDEVSKRTHGGRTSQNVHFDPGQVTNCSPYKNNQPNTATLPISLSGSGDSVYINGAQIGAISAHGYPQSISSASSFFPQETSSMYSGLTNNGIHADCSLGAHQNVRDALMYFNGNGFNVSRSNDVGQEYETQLNVPLHNNYLNSNVIDEQYLTAPDSSETTNGQVPYVSVPYVVHEQGMVNSEAVTLNMQHQNIDALASSEYNRSNTALSFVDWSLDFADFDDSLFLATQNSVSDLNEC